MILRSVLLSAVAISLSAATACAHATEWSGKMACGELQNAPRDQFTEPFVGNVNLRIDGNTAVLDRYGQRARERLQGNFERGSPLMLEGTGWFHSNERSTWKVRAQLLELGQRFEGIAVMESHDGKTKYRDCTVSLERSTVHASSTTNLPSAKEERKAGNIAAGSAPKSDRSTSLPASRLAAANAPVMPSRSEGLVSLPDYNRLVDLTNTLTSDEHLALDSRLRVLSSTTDWELAVVILHSTKPEDIQSYSRRLGNHWNVGSKKGGNGLLIVLAKADRRVRIEVSDNLRVAMPDESVRKIIDTALVPALRTGNYAGGIGKAIDELSRRPATTTASSSSTSAPSPGRDRGSPIAMEKSPTQRQGQIGTEAASSSSQENKPAAPQPSPGVHGGVVYRCMGNKDAKTADLFTFLNDGRFLQIGYMKSDDGNFFPFSWIVGDFTKSDDLYIRRNLISASILNAKWEKLSKIVEIRERFIFQTDEKIQKKNILTLNDGQPLGPQPTTVCRDETTAARVSEAHELIKIGPARGRIFVEAYPAALAPNARCSELPSISGKPLDVTPMQALNQLKPAREKAMEALIAAENRSPFCRASAKVLEGEIRRADAMFRDLQKFAEHEVPQGGQVPAERFILICQRYAQVERLGSQCR